MTQPTTQGEHDVATLLATIQAPPNSPRPDRPWFCPRCSEPSKPYGVPCAKCRPIATIELRRERLSGAFSSIPRRYAAASFDAPGLPSWVPNAKAVREARAATDDPRIVLQGPAGKGKTTLAACIVQTILASALETGATVEQWRRAEALFWTSAYQLATARTKIKLGEGEAPIVDRAINATVLVLDDLGAEPRIHNSPIAEVLHARDEADAGSTIVTTGFSEKQLSERYGAGITRRLFENAVLILPGGPLTTENEDR